MLVDREVEFMRLIPSVDESSVCCHDPRERAVAVASLKSHAVLDLLGGSTPAPILACDTIVVLDGKMFGKPADPAEARAMLRELSGRTHQVVSGDSFVFNGAAPAEIYGFGVGAVSTASDMSASGVPVSDGESAPSSVVIEFSRVTDVTFRDLSDEEIDCYIATGEPFDMAGGYGIQGEGGRFVARVEGDYDNIVGMPADDVLATIASFEPASLAKEDIRKVMSAIRKTISAPEREQASRLACEALVASADFDSAEVIAAYTSFGSELSLRALIEAMPADKTLAVPCTMADRRMEFVAVEPIEVLECTSSLPFICAPACVIELPDGVRVVEAHEIDLMLVPGLAFDDLGYRLGYGGGYYDTYMSCPGFDARVIGTFFDQQRFFGHLPAEPHDRALPMIATQSGVGGDSWWTRSA